MRVLAVCGSLQAKSGNLELLKTAAASVPPGVELVIFDGLRNLPHFNPDIEAGGVPLNVTPWRLAVSASDAVLIATPESRRVEVAHVGAVSGERSCGHEAHIGIVRSVLNGVRRPRARRHVFFGM